MYALLIYKYIHLRIIVKYEREECSLGRLVWKNFTEVSMGHDNSSSVIEVGDSTSLINVGNLL
jgi:hypothetical protein